MPETTIQNHNKPLSWQLAQAQSDNNKLNVAICYKQLEIRRAQSNHTHLNRNQTIVSHHFLWLESLHICLADLKSRKFNTVWRHGKGIVLWQIYNLMNSWLLGRAGPLESVGICFIPSRLWTTVNYIWRIAGLLSRAYGLLWTTGILSGAYLLCMWWI